MGTIGKLPISNKTSWPWHDESRSNLYNTDIDWPKISIVTPSFNQGRYIEETIRSVLLQNYPNLEYIIIDGGSTDNSVEIIKKYERWISYWVSEPDNGQTHAINKGIEICSGEVFNWLNSDDLLSPKSLYHIGKSIHENPKNDVFCYSIYYLRGQEFTWLNPPTYYNPKSVQKTLELGTVNQPGMYYKRSALELIGQLNEDLNLVMDYDLWLRYLLMNQYPQVYCDSGKFPIAYFRIHEESKTTKEEYNILTDFQKEIIELCVGNDNKNRLKRALKIKKPVSKNAEIIHNCPHDFNAKIFLNTLLLNFAVSNYYKFQKKNVLKLLFSINPFSLERKKLRDWFYILRKSILAIIHYPTT